MNEIISCTVYRFNEDNAVVELEINENPKNILLHELQLDYSEAIDIKFLNQDGSEVIGDEDNIPNLDKTRMAFIAYDSDEGNDATKECTLRSQYSEKEILKILEYPQRLEEILVFHDEYGDEMFRDPPKVEEFNVASFELKAQKGSMEAMKKLAYHYRFKENDIDKALDMQLKISIADPNEENHFALYTIYIEKGEKLLAESYLHKGIAIKDIRCVYEIAERSYLSDTPNNEKTLNYLINYFNVNHELYSTKPSDDDESWFEDSDYEFFREIHACEILHKVLNQDETVFTANSNITSLEKNLKHLSNIGLTLAQYILASLYKRGVLGEANISLAKEYYLKCLENAFTKRLRGNSRNKKTFFVQCRRDAITNLLEISSSDDEEVSPYVVESVFIPKFYSTTGFFSRSRSFDEFTYEQYMAAIGGNRNEETSFRNHLCVETHGSKSEIIFAMNYYIYWQMLVNIHADEFEKINERFYAFDMDDKSFDMLLHKQMLDTLYKLGQEGNVDALKIFDLVEEYPFLFTVRLKQKPNTIGNKGNLVEPTFTNDLDCAMAYFKGRVVPKNYTKALESFEKVISSGSDKKQIKTAVKFLIKMYSKGLGTEKNMDKVLSLKNKLMTL